jgi:hypothetical protein
MHETVTRVRRRIRDERPRDGVGESVSRRFQGTGISRALSEPLAAQFELLYRECHAWLRLAGSLEEGGPNTEAVFGELLCVCRRVRMVLDDLVPFLERVEDNLGEREEITYRESAYEREVVPFSRLESTQALRSYLAAHPAFGIDLASVGAQIQADLLKIIYLEDRLWESAPKPFDLYAMVVELLLDARRHLSPGFEEGSPLLSAMARASAPA